MKLLLAVLALVSAGTAAADCPKAADWARAFYSEHYLFYADAPDPILQLTTPEFGALLKKEWAYSKGEVGHFDYDPWLGAAQDMAIVSIAGTFTISSLRSANRCHMCTQLRSPNRARQPTGALGALRG
jgi:hypothetical protein